MDHPEKKKTQTLEVTVISGENLCLDWNPMTENTYVEVRTESLKCWTTKMANKCSNSEEEGSSLGYPTWNDKLRVEVPLHAKSITFEVKCKTSKDVARSVGLARIAISDVLKKREDGHIVGGDALQKEGCLNLHVLSYRLRNWEGRRCGVLNFSVRELTNEEEKEENSSNLKYEKKKKKEMMIMDHDDDLMGYSNNNNNNMNEVVMGVPVWCNHLGIHA